MELVIIIFILLVAVIIFLCYSGYSTEIIGGFANIAGRKNIKEHPQSKFETHVRNIFGNIAKTSLSIAGHKNTRDYRFYTMYPEWLKWKVPGTDHVKQLEIDGYNELLGLAFEVQGPLHTKFDKKVDKTYANYYNRLCNDAAKKKLCEDYGIGFITVDYKIPKHLLSDYIKSRIYDLCQDAPKKLRCDLLAPYSEHKPENYIQVIVNEPFRDLDAEAELKN